MHMRSCVRNLETPLEWAEKLRYKLICKVWSSANKGNWHWNLKSYGLVCGWKLPWLSVITRQEERQRRHEKTEVKRRTSNEERRKKERQGAPKKKRLATTKKKRTTKELKEESPEVSWFLYEFFRDCVPEKFKTCLINRHLILASVYNSLLFYHNDIFKQYSDYIISFIIVHQNIKNIENSLKRASVAVNWRKSVPRVEANGFCSWKAQKKASSYQFGKFLFEGLMNGLSLKRNHFI